MLNFIEFFFGVNKKDNNNEFYQSQLNKNTFVLKKNLL